MKIFKKILLVLIIAILCLGVVACTRNGGGPITGPNNKNLTPADITKLANLTNYGRESKYYGTAAVPYSDISTEKEKLANRINEKKEDALLPDTSSVIKIFAASDAEQIIAAMSEAALPAAKMTKTVDYMAGEEEEVDEGVIDTKVATGIWSATTGWSFFDDWSYYEKLQDRADANVSTDTDDDNVKRQYRNIAGKVFTLGMTGDEFARVATYQLKYSLEVVKKMSGGYDLGTTQFDNYCKEELDYDTLTYLKAFNDYYNGGLGLSDCVELYGYYYDYNQNNYNAVSDEDFEKELLYSHYITFTDAEWLEYVAIQRNNYINAYRYNDSFYNDLYSKHFSFQEKKENFDYEVYGFAIYSGLTNTGELRQAITGNGLQGQLNMSDWMWCYSGSDVAMKNYNQANTKYENGKGKSDQLSNEGKFYYEMEQLKIISYLLTNMTSQNLSGALRYQIYSYSGSMVQSISNNEKDIILMEDGKKDIVDVTTILDGLEGSDAKAYAQGKVRAIINQMKSSYETVGVTSKAQQATSQSWSTMNNEVTVALEYDYDSLSSWKEKVERLEDLIIKRKYDCGVGLDDVCPRGNGHAECIKEYDTDHTISHFVSNYEQILKHVGGKVVLSFQQNNEETSEKPNNYVIKEFTNLPKTYNCGYGAVNPVTKEMLAKVTYFEKQEISISRGKVFKVDVENSEEEQLKWWKSKTRDPVKASSSVQESDGSNNSWTYTYRYEFNGWYLDQLLEYKFDPSDTINCDLNLYAGYNVTKIG